MTKCRVLAAGIGSAALLFFWIGLASEGLTRALAWWVTLACSLSAAAYLANWPGIYGKRDGRLVAPALCLTEVGGEGLQASDVSPHPSHLRLSLVFRLRRARNGMHVSIGECLSMGIQLGV